MKGCVALLSHRCAGTEITSDCRAGLVSCSRKFRQIWAPNLWPLWGLSVWKGGQPGIRSTPASDRLIIIYFKVFQLNSPEVTTGTSGRIEGKEDNKRKKKDRKMLKRLRKGLWNYRNFTLIVLTPLLLLPLPVVVGTKVSLICISKTGQYIFFKSIRLSLLIKANWTEWIKEHGCSFYLFETVIITLVTLS